MKAGENLLKGALEGQNRSEKVSVLPWGRARHGALGEPAWQRTFGVDRTAMDFARRHTATHFSFQHLFYSREILRFLSYSPWSFDQVAGNLRGALLHGCRIREDRPAQFHELVRRT